MDLYVLDLIYRKIVFLLNISLNFRNNFSVSKAKDTAFNFYATYTYYILDLPSNQKKVTKQQSLCLSISVRLRFSWSFSVIQMMRKHQSKCRYCIPSPKKATSYGIQIIFPKKFCVLLKNKFHYPYCEPHYNAKQEHLCNVKVAFCFFNLSTLKCFVVHFRLLQCSVHNSTAFP